MKVKLFFLLQVITAVSLTGYEVFCKCVVRFRTSRNDKTGQARQDKKSAQMIGPPAVVNRNDSSGLGNKDYLTDVCQLFTLTKFIFYIIFYICSVVVHKFVSFFG